MKITLNGNPEMVSDQASLEETLLATLGTERLGLGGIAVAVNREIVPRSEWASRRLREGDQVEVLTAAQGG
jgi:sulfur carrier protein